MTAVAAALLLSLAGPAAPGGKADKGIPKELIDLLPEDTAGVMVIDATKAGKSEIGQTILKLFAAEQRPGETIEFAELGREARWVVLGQFLIDEGVGDFCLIARLKDGSKYGQALIAKAKGDKQPMEQIGTRVVYSLHRPEIAVARIDDRTLMVVVAAGETPNQVKQTRLAAFADRDKPGPNRELRKLIEEGTKDDRPVQMYGSHPKKLALAAYLPLASFGVKRTAVAELGDKLLSYRGGIRMGDAGEVELRLTAKDAAAAGELMKAYEVMDDRLPPFVKEFRRGQGRARKGRSGLHAQANEGDRGVGGSEAEQVGGLLGGLVGRLFEHLLEAGGELVGQGLVGQGVGDADGVPVRVHVDGHGTHPHRCRWSRLCCSSDSEPSTKSISSSATFRQVNVIARAPA